MQRRLGTSTVPLTRIISTLLLIAIGGSISTGATQDTARATFHAPKTAKQTLGVALTLTELSRQPGRRGTRVIYRVTTAGFPDNKTYRLETSSLSDPVPTVWLRNIRAESGTLAAGEGADKASVDLSKLNLTIEEYNEGEFFMVEVTSDDGAVYAADRVYPFPIVASDGDCLVWAELLNKNRKSFGIMGNGFVPGSPLETISWEDNRSDHKNSLEQAGPDGRFTIQVTHRRSGGRAAFSATGKHCSVLRNTSLAAMRRARSEAIIATENSPSPSSPLRPACR
jgi:hypothetical protein